MFHASNFTESSESFESLERLMRTSAGMQEYIRTRAEDDVDRIVVRFAHEAYLSRFGMVPEDLETPYLDDEHQTAWAIFANRTQWCARWGGLAFPRIQMSHSFAAMLMATTVSRKEIPSIEAPWPAFLLEVPDGLLPIATKDGTMTHITRIHVNTSFLPSLWTDPPSWGLELVGPGIEIHRIGAITEAFEPSKRIKERPLLKLHENFRIEARDQPLGDIEDFWSGYDHSQEDRVAILAARLVLGACIMMTDKTQVRERPAKLVPELANHRRRFGYEPISKVHVLGKPVKVDFRLAVKAYVEGDSKSLSVQSLVAGHHKNQPHGPGNTLRKWIWVQPYWRGPEDGPIVVRPHVLDEPPV